MARWQEQLDRAKRFLERAKSVREPREDHEDFLWAFFQNCWHLKDWIKKEPSLPISQKDLEDELRRTKGHVHENLMICADIANGTKHLGFRSEKDKRVGAVGGARTWELSPGRSTSWSDVIRLDDGSEKPALEVADGAIAEWEKLIETWRL